MHRTKNFLKSNRGFSLVEMIIVIAIMAVLVGIMAPMFLMYVKESKRTVDVDSAMKMVKAVHIMTAEGVPCTDEKYYWNTSTTMSGTDIYAKAFQHIGLVPKSVTDENYTWYIYYSNDKKSVVCIYLLDNASSTQGYELYPDSEAFVKDEALTPVNKY
ncbi:MAG: prepilin-type N-terminal cleavage/methylation domain-containing protein [Lachnospiraceae bacterium]|nr:prepilin-type N-terminal cleavage/methylation domain-containing protein [Lachnospiraceae bacterium]